TSAASSGSSCRSDTSRFEPRGSCAFQLLRLPSSLATIGMTATGGSVVSRASPHVKSMLTSIEKKKNEIDAVPCACHGVGPSSVRSMPSPQTPTPNTFTENDVEISTVKWNGENSMSASNPECPSTESAENPKNMSECEPNWTVFVV